MMLNRKPDGGCRLFEIGGVNGGVDQQLTRQNSSDFEKKNIDVHDHGYYFEGGQDQSDQQMVQIELQSVDPDNIGNGIVGNN